MKDKLSETDMNYKEMHINIEKERLEMTQKIKELEKDSLSIDIYSRRYDEERQRNKELDQVNNELLMKINEHRIEYEKIKEEHRKQLEQSRYDYDKKLVDLKELYTNVIIISNVINVLIMKNRRKMY